VVSWEPVATGIGFPEGLAWSAGDDTMIVSAVAEGAVYVVSPGDHRKERIADTRGCANGCTLADDGTVLVSQNGNTGGWVQAALNRGEPGRFPPTAPTAPGLQRVFRDGQVTYLADGGFGAPNDVTVGPDGSVYFTDPGIAGQGPDYTGGRVIAYRPDASVEVIADGLFYPNGIQVDSKGDVVIAERDGLLRIEPDGTTVWIVEDIGGRVDGLCLDVDGRYYVAGQAGIQVVDPDGQVQEFLSLPGTMTSNCCFGGPELRWLFVTDAMGGSVLVSVDLPTPGMPVALWPAPSQSTNP
jgi:gluconolactonase